ncbi:MAG: BBP7 family outer membrane beta-barrel protein [Pirellulales bacterium]|nr:BBP7 family outer membrane beta-barrel protein [Pirellulales bacterium]
MLKKRIKSWLLAWGVGASLAVGAISTEAQAQRGAPFLSGEIKEVDKHIFAPADLSTFDELPAPNTGYWLEVGYVQMWTSAPDRATIGNSRTAPRLVIDGASNGIGIPSLRLETNTADTSRFSSERRSGHRTSLGYMGDDSGWSATMFDMGDFSSEFVANDSEVILFDPLGGLTGFVDLNNDGNDDDLDGDLIFGRSGVDTSAPPDGTPDTFAPVDLGDIIAQRLAFTSLNVRTDVTSWGFQASRDLRLGTSRSGTFDFSYGARYFKFNEDFLVTATGGTVFTDAFWDTTADNDLVGPMIAGRWFRTRGRWTWSVDSSFTAALNFQGLRQTGRFDGNAGFSPTFIQDVTFNNTAHETEFAPIVELGFNARYQITSKFYANIGWRGMFIDNIARPQTLVNYTFPTMGILAGHNRQELFIHGLQISASFNH